METIELGYEILRFPDKEEGLAFLERVCRVAYASEGAIDNGKGPCPECNGTCDNDHTCMACEGKGWIQVRDPSAIKLLRKVMKADRRKRLANRIVGMIDAGSYMLSTEDFAKVIVDLVFNTIQNDPPHNAIGDHLHATVLFHVGRGFTHELVRHRIGVGYLQRSTRWCGAGESGKGLQVIARNREDFASSDQALDQWYDAMTDSERQFQAIADAEVTAGATRRDATQYARGVLPIDTYAPIVVTGSFTYWRHLFRMRTSPAAHPDMHKVMCPLLAEFRQLFPIMFEELI